MRSSLVGDYEKRQKEVFNGNGLYDRLSRNGIIASNLEVELDSDKGKEMAGIMFAEVEKYHVDYEGTLRYVTEKREELDVLTKQIKNDVKRKISPLYNFFCKITRKDFEDLSSLVDNEVEVVKDISEKFNGVVAGHEAIRKGLNDFYTQSCFTLDNCEKKNTSLSTEKNEHYVSANKISEKANETEGRFIVLAARERIKDKIVSIDSKLAMNTERYNYFIKLLPQVEKLKTVFNSTSSTFARTNEILQNQREEIIGTKSSLIALMNAGELSMELKRILQDLNESVESVYRGVNDGIRKVEGVYRNYRAPRKNL
ncbi:MAG TPA: hypothetical protein VJB94_01390 [Candidatus Nanoarchaeia archaeon]|nr:hypothetical protein [Candidatus Nanoarchaeia archaeon]